MSSLLAFVLAQLEEGSLFEQVLTRVLRLAFWVLVLLPFILVPIYFFGLSI